MYPSYYLVPFVCLAGRETGKCVFEFERLGYVWLWKENIRERKKKCYGPSLDDIESLREKTYVFYCLLESYRGLGS